MKDSKELLLILKFFKKQIKVIVPLKEQELGFYKHFVEFACKYEEVNTKNAKQYGENTSEINITILTGEGKTLDMKEKL